VVSKSHKLTSTAGTYPILSCYIYQMQADFEAKVEVAFNRMITERATSRVDRTGKRHPLAC
jgi:hypothetical protein